MSGKNVRETCSILPPRQQDMLGHDLPAGYSAECILPPHPQYETHVLRGPNGVLVSWQSDDECECCRDEEDPNDRCVIYGPITEAEYRQVLDEIAVHMATLNGETCKEE